MIVALFAVTAVAVFAANVETTDNTVAWHGKTEPGKVVWRHVKNGGERFKYALPVEKYTHVFETDTINIMCMPPGDGQYLEKSHNRCDGWFLVSPEQSGTWAVVAGYDDYIAIGFDEKWLVKNSKDDVARKSSWEATSGLHKFTLVFGDTGGTYGNKGKTRIPYAVSISVNGGGWLPFDDMVKAAANGESRIENRELKVENGSSRTDGALSTVLQEMLDIFSADDGLSAAEKIPALKLIQDRALNEMKNRSFNDQKLQSFRHGTIHDVGMDFGLGLVEEKGMKITRNGKYVSKYEYGDNLQECVNNAHRVITGHDLAKSFINVMFSGNREAYLNKKILDASENAQQMREMILNASTSDIQQMMDASRIETIEMEATKQHPKIVELYEACRGWNKDLTVKYLPALEEEIMALKTTEKNLMRQGKSLAKSDLLKLERLTKTHKKYKQISEICGKIGRMEMPLYDANEAIRTVTGGPGLVETIDELEATFQTLSLQHSDRAKKIKKDRGM